jgi:hypothetical protein
MIGAVITIFVAIWIYQTAVKAKIANITMWWAGAALAFYVMQVVLVGINISLFDLDGTKTESAAMLKSDDEVCKSIKADAQKANSKAGEKDGDMGQFKDSSCSAVHGEDRQDKERYSGFGGGLKSLYYELFPCILSFLAIAFLRVKFITKEALNATNLFGGLKEMFQGIFQNIKQSFKSSSN